MKNKEFFHRLDPTWCKGCGLFGVFDALKRAAAELDLESTWRPFSSMRSRRRSCT